MNETFLAYYEDLRMPSELIERAERAHDFYHLIATGGRELERTFVSETVSTSGRLFESVWFFLGSVGMEAHDFGYSYDYDLGYFDGTDYWRFNQTKYDFLEATSESRLVLTIGGPVGAEMNASGANCDVLRDLVGEWLVPLTISKWWEARDD